MALIRFEQAVYGSFPFWDRGYAVLAHSPGCRSDWLDELRAICQRYGERPDGSAEVGGVFALRMESGPWVIVGPSLQGADDRGRPGALAFHSLFLRPREYRRAGFDPFGFAGALRKDWTAATRTLESGVRAIDPLGSPIPPLDDRAPRIVAALIRGRRVALEAAGPIDGLARQVWRGLPERLRARASVATWAFANGNRFDLVALPRLVGISLDSSYVDPAEDRLLTASCAVEIPLVRRDGERGASAPCPVLGKRQGADAPRSPNPDDASDRARFSRHLASLGLVAILAGVFAGLAWRLGHGRSSIAAPRPAIDRAAPDPAASRDEPMDPSDHRRVAEALANMSDRFGVVKPDADGHERDPADLMVLLARELRYRGRWLSPEELARLKRASGRDRELALLWDARVRRFQDDRPLPPGFARGPLRWQLETLAWSFHLDDDPNAPRRNTGEIPHALAEALAVDVPLRPNPLEARYPALTDYRRFLGRLPRR